ncbi:MAG: caspase family protein [Magnetospiraceae bacterium]
MATLAFALSLTAAPAAQADERSDCLGGSGTIKSCAAATKTHGSDAEVWAKLGRLYFNAKNYKRAVQVLQKAKSLAPGDATVADFYNRAKSYLDEQEYIANREANKPTANAGSARMDRIKCLRLEKKDACQRFLKSTPGDAEVRAKLQALGGGAPVVVAAKPDPAPQAAPTPKPVATPKPAPAPVVQTPKPAPKPDFTAIAKVKPDDLRLATPEEAATMLAMADPEATPAEPAKPAEPLVAEAPAPAPVPEKPAEPQVSEAPEPVLVPEKPVETQLAEAPIPAKPVAPVVEKPADTPAAPKAPEAQEPIRIAALPTEEAVITRSIDPNEVAPKPAQASKPIVGIEAQLSLLKRLYDQGLVDEAEYERRKILLLNTVLGMDLAVAPVVEAPIAPPADVVTNEPDLTQEFVSQFGNRRYHALIIGNNDYMHLRDLKTAVTDAFVLAEVLETRYGFETTVLRNATRRDILKAMSDLRRTLTEDDSLLVYYAGHGILDEDAERGYWLPVDAEEDVKANWISTADVTDLLKATDAWHALVVADSCYSGTLIRGGLTPIRGSGSRLALLKRLAQKRSRTVITSGGLEPVSDGGGGEHSVFARALIDALQDNNEVIEAQGLFELIRTRVVVNADQTPEYSDVRKAGHDGGDFIFVPQTGTDQ